MVPMGDARATHGLAARTSHHPLSPKTRFGSSSRDTMTATTAYSMHNLPKPMQTSYTLANMRSPVVRVPCVCVKVTGQICATLTHPLDPSPGFSDWPHLR